MHETIRQSSLPLFLSKAERVYVTSKEEEEKEKGKREANCCALDCRANLYPRRVAHTFFDSLFRKVIIALGDSALFLTMVVAKLVFICMNNVASFYITA